MGVAELMPNDQGRSQPTLTTSAPDAIAGSMQTMAPPVGTHVASGHESAFVPVAEPKRSLPERLVRGRGRDLAAARQPFPGPSMLRVFMATLLSFLCLLTLGGAILLLLLWQQERDTGLLTSQIDRTWDIFDVLRDIERLVAYAVVPVATAWIAMATINVHRATGERRSVVFAALSLPVGIGAIWYVGDRLVADAPNDMAKASGIALQIAFVALPMLALERVAEAADARHRPLRVLFLVAVAFLIHLQTVGGISTTEVTADSERWSRLGAYLVIGALIQVLGALAANEAARAIEEATDHRYQLRHRFGEALLGQVGHIPTRR